MAKNYGFEINEQMEWPEVKEKIMEAMREKGVPVGKYRYILILPRCKSFWNHLYEFWFVFFIRQWLFCLWSLQMIRKNSSPTWWRNSRNISHSSWNSWTTCVREKTLLKSEHFPITLLFTHLYIPIDKQYSVLSITKGASTCNNILNGRSYQICDGVSNLRIQFTFCKNERCF